MPEELEPIDFSTCQAEEKKGSFMTLGPHKYVRCTQPPTWLAVSIKGGNFDGAMSLCDECKKVCEIRMSEIQALEVSYQKLKV